MAGTLLWLAVCAPLAVLLAWISDTSVLTMLGRSLLFAIPLTIWMWFSVQSANLYFKWPTLQLLGWTTVLISALNICTPLLLFLPAPATGFIALGLWLMLCAYGVFAAHKIHNKVLRISHHKIQSPVRFVQISDIHAGSRSRVFIQKCIEQALSHQPDAILITGVNEFPPPVLDEVVEAELEVFLWCCICICGEPDLLELLEASPEVVGLFSLSC